MMLVIGFSLIPLTAFEFEADGQFIAAEPEKELVTGNNSSEIYLRTDVSNARIYLNGEYQGTSNLVLKGLLPAEYFLTIEKDGYKTQTIIVKVVKNLRREYYFVLEKTEELQE